MNSATKVRPEPRFELWNLALPAGVKSLWFAQFGVQAATPESAGRELERYRPLFDGPDGPAELSRGSFVDTEGLANAVFLAYWFDPEGYARWSASRKVTQGWSDLPSDGPAGYWREIVRVPVERMDTLYTPHDPAAFDQTGVARHGKMHLCKAHDYWGAVRDRLPELSEQDLAPESTRYEPATADTRGRRISIRVPANVCMARHHEDWRNSPVSRNAFLDGVAPIKEAGVAYLATHPETGAITSRAIHGEDLAGKAIGRADAIVWFLSLEHLLKWARSDPSHLSIYAAFFKAATTMKDGEKWDVPMWHEVFVVPEGAAEAHYVNCHNRTGFLTLHER